MDQLQKKKKFNIARALWEAWKRLGRRLADIQIRGMLILFYFIIIAPFALAIRWKGDPLGIKAIGSPAWQSMPNRESDFMDEARRQF